MKTKRKGETPYSGKINTHVPSGRCIHSTFAYRDVFDPLKMYHGMHYVEKFIEHFEDEVKHLYATFPQQLMTELTDVLKREHEAAGKCHICLKEFPDPERDHCPYIGLYRGAVQNNFNLKY